MDNFHIDITGEGEKSLRKAIKIAFAHNAAGHTALSYEIKTMVGAEFDEVLDSLASRTAFVFRWVGRTDKDPDTVSNFPFRIDADGAADFAIRWLEQAEFGKEPDQDGDNYRGWRIYTGAWGHVGSDNYAICAVFPAWAMYGK
jgi:hypothetical protein